jgi:hypothetical protein
VGLIQRSQLVERRQHVGLEPRPQPPHLAQPLGQRRLAQRLRGVDAKRVVQQAHPLGAQPRQARDRDHARRELRAQPLRRRDRPGVQQRHDLLLQGRPDPRQLRRAARPRERRHRHRRLAHHLRRRAIGQHPVHDRTVQLVQVPQLRQGVGDRGIR